MDEYEKLFSSYVIELAQKKEAAEDWWGRLLTSEEAYKRNTLVGDLSVRERWPFGPASHPWVIATFRKYYLLCEQLNNKLEYNVFESPMFPQESDWGITDKVTDKNHSGFVHPKVFTIDWLASEETNELYEFMLFLVFLPIGIKDGKTV